MSTDCHSTGLSGDMENAGFEKEFQETSGEAAIAPLQDLLFARTSPDDV